MSVCGKHNLQLLLWPNKTPVFRVTRYYLNLLVKPRIFSGFLEKHDFINFKMPKNVCLFFQKICVPSLTRYPKHTYFFIWPHDFGTFR